MSTIPNGKYVEPRQTILVPWSSFWYAQVAEATFEPEHPNVATSLDNLAELYRAQSKYTEAEPLYQRALAIREKALAPERSRSVTEAERKRQASQTLTPASTPRRQGLTS